MTGRILAESHEGVVDSERGGRSVRTCGNCTPGRLSSRKALDHDNVQG